MGIYSKGSKILEEIVFSSKHFKYCIYQDRSPRRHLTCYNINKMSDTQVIRTDKFISLRWLS